MNKTKAINLKKLSPKQIAVLEDKETEAPFTGKFLYHKENGTYVCAGCGSAIFESSAKFDSGSGWPSFDKAIPGSIKQVKDNSYGMTRTEVFCANCGAHLGHLFDDGPKETTGKRFCINSLSLDFIPEKTKKAKLKK